MNVWGTCDIERHDYNLWAKEKKRECINNNLELYQSKTMKSKEKNEGLSKLFGGGGGKRSKRNFSFSFH